MRGLTLLAGALLACGEPSPKVPAPQPSAAPVASPPSASSAPAPVPLASAAPGAPIESPLELGTWQRSLEVPVVSLAIGKRRVAALAEDGSAVWQHEDGAWRELAIPEKLRAAKGDGVRVFFGRDDRPRLMGGAERQVYLRYKRGAGAPGQEQHGWISGRDEIGRLAGDPPAALFGVLGHDDPEVVCKLGDTCIIKRLTGWTYVPPAERLLVELSGAQAWGVSPRALQRLEKDGWKRIDAPFDAPAGVGGFAVLWVSEPGTSKIHRFAGGWTATDAPVAGPRTIAGTKDDDLWLAGDGGLAHFDGTAWRRVAGVEGPLADVRVSADAVWAGGGSGVWRGTFSR